MEVKRTKEIKCWSSWPLVGDCANCSYQK